MLNSNVKEEREADVGVKFWSVLTKVHSPVVLINLLEYCIDTIIVSYSEQTHMFALYCLKS